MKKIICTILAVLLLSSYSAKAINKEWSAALGFIGGVLVSEAYYNNMPRTRTVYYEPTYRHCEPHGYYTTRTERYWVSGKYITRYSDCGIRYTEYIPGHYEYRDVRVFVEY